MATPIQVSDNEGTTWRDQTAREALDYALRQITGKYGLEDLVQIIREDIQTDEPLR